MKDELGNRIKSNYEDRTRVLDYENFNIKDVLLFGENFLLITPKEIGTSWTVDNLIFRSCLLRKEDYFPISLSWPKFFNFGEKSDLYPDFEKFDDWIIDEKEDGSTILIS